MEVTRPAALVGVLSANAHRAKAALRRLALDRLEPTPDNYARAWRQESGGPSAGAAPNDPPPVDGAALATLIERIVRGTERSTRDWTAARRKDSLQRVLVSSRSDVRRLQQRLTQLVASWDGEAGDAEFSSTQNGPPSDFLPTLALPLPVEAATPPPAPWGRALAALGGTLQQALPAQDDAPHEIAQALAALVERIDADGASPALIDALEGLCRRATPVLRHRHHLIDQLGGLCADLTASLTDLAESDSWAKGQCEAMRLEIDAGLNARGVRAVSELLRDTRARQGVLRAERERARDSLKGLINRMLSELDELGSQTGNFHDSVGRYADVIEQADSLESLAGVVREMVEESRTVQSLVQQTQARLQQEHSKASGLTQRVNELETEMQRLSDEVSTDQLTQIANRRGLLQAFEAGRAARVHRRAARGRPARHRQLQAAQRRTRPRCRRRGVEGARRAGQPDPAADRQRGALRRRGVRRAAARHAARRGAADPDPAATFADRGSLHARAEAGARDLLRRRHRLPARRAHRSVARARRPGALRSQAQRQEPHLRRLTPALEEMRLGHFPRSPWGTAAARRRPGGVQQSFRLAPTAPWPLCASTAPTASRSLRRCCLANVPARVACPSIVALFDRPLQASR